jgi:hypothetical protein
MKNLIESIEHLLSGVECDLTERVNPLAEAIRKKVRQSAKNLNLSDAKVRRVKEDNRTGYVPWNDTRRAFKLRWPTEIELEVEVPLHLSKAEAQQLGDDKSPWLREEGHRERNVATLKVGDVVTFQTSLDHLSLERTELIKRASRAQQKVLLHDFWWPRRHQERFTHGEYANFEVKVEKPLTIIKTGWGSDGARVIRQTSRGTDLKWKMWIKVAYDVDPDSSRGTFG